MTRLFSHTTASKSPATHAIAALGGVLLVALCATGIAAFVGLLPESGHVAAAMTAAPIIDVQVNDRRDEPTARIEPRIKAQARGARRLDWERLQHVVIVA